MFEESAIGHVSKSLILGDVFNFAQGPTRSCQYLGRPCA
jgi:hypothetical protein